MLSAVPTWLIRKKTFAAGMRLPKRGRWYESGGHKGGYTYAPLYPARPVVQSSMNGVLERRGDLLSNGDLRFWNGINFKDSYAVCRSCRGVYHYAKERKAHLKEAGCGSVLTRAMKLLRRSDRCLICDDQTKKTCWGLPLCTRECQSEWAWTTACPDALRAALDLVEREDQKI